MTKNVRIIFSNKAVPRFLNSVMVVEFIAAKG